MQEYSPARKHGNDKDKSRQKKVNKPRSDPMSHQNRKSAQASRTLKACELCRRQKTRCFRSPENPLSCLRCTFLNKTCSFETNPEPVHFNGQPTNAANGTEVESNEGKMKLDLIYSGVNEILTLLKTNNGQVGLLNSDAKLLLDAASSMKKGTDDSEFEQKGHDTPVTGSSLLNSIQHHLADNEDNEDTQYFIQSPADSSRVSPFSIVKYQVNESFIPKPIDNLLNLSTVGESGSMVDPKEDILSLGYLSQSEAIDLMTDFRRNYGRWVSFPQNVDTAELINRIRFKSPLLLITCCVLSLRYSLNASPSDVDNLRRRKKTYKLLFNQLVKNLSKSVMIYTAFQRSSDNSGDIEFLQALVILSIYSLSLSSVASAIDNEDNHTETNDDIDLKKIGLDPWFMSGIGLTTFLSKTTTGSLFDSKKSSPSNEIMEDPRSPFTILYDNMDTDDYQMLTFMRIYNHLTLVHLINCIFSGRMCVLDEIRLNYCTSTLNLPSATNFDGRMISEISILLITYNYIQVCSNASSTDFKDCETNFAAVVDDVRLWYDQWDHLFHQPSLQFVQFCYEFCLVTIYYTYNYQKYSIMTKENNVTLGSKEPDLFKESNVALVLSHSSDEDIIKLIEHSHKVVKYIHLIDNDSYFAYLSDQIHFCFYFGAVMLIKISRFVKVTSKTYLLEQVENTSFQSLEMEFVKDLKSLIKKFGKIGQDNDDDIAIKYKLGLEDLLKQDLKENNESD